VAPDRVRLALVDRVDTRADWPFAFHFALEVVLSDALHVRFVHTNTAPVAVEVAGALHTYVRAHDATLHGLEDSPFHDKLVGQDRPPEHRPLVVDQAMDRIYAGRPVVRVAHAEGTLVAEQDTPAVVVWNPGAEKAAAMPDLGAGEHRAFVCVEAAATQLQTVVSGGTWSLSQRLRVES
jgi:glucose-6-phosphate 1-epimerase